MDNLSYGDFVQMKDNSTKDYVFLEWSVPKTIAKFCDITNDSIVDISVDKLVKIDSGDSSIYYAPIFSKFQLLQEVFLVSENLRGTIIAVNPQLIPLNREANYLISLASGEICESMESNLRIVP